MWQGDILSDECDCSYCSLYFVPSFYPTEKANGDLRLHHELHDLLNEIYRKSVWIFEEILNRETKFSQLLAPINKLAQDEIAYIIPSFYGDSSFKQSIVLSLYISGTNPWNKCDIQLLLNTLNQKDSSYRPILIALCNWFTQLSKYVCCLPIDTWKGFINKFIDSIQNDIPQRQETAFGLIHVIQTYLESEGFNLRHNKDELKSHLNCFMNRLSGWVNAVEKINESRSRASSGLGSSVGNSSLSLNSSPNPSPSLDISSSPDAQRKKVAASGSHNKPKYEKQTDRIITNLFADTERLLRAIHEALNPFLASQMEGYDLPTQDFNTYQSIMNNHNYDQLNGCIERNLRPVLAKENPLMIKDYYKILIAAAETAITAAAYKLIFQKKIVSYLRANEKIRKKHKATIKIIDQSFNQAYFNNEEEQLRLQDVLTPNQLAWQESSALVNRDAELQAYNTINDLLREINTITIEINHKKDDLEQLDGMVRMQSQLRAHIDSTQQLTQQINNLQNKWWKSDADKEQINILKRELSKEQSSYTQRKNFYDQNKQDLLNKYHNRIREGQEDFTSKFVQRFIGLWQYDIKKLQQEISNMRQRIAEEKRKLTANNIAATEKLKLQRTWIVKRAENIQQQNLLEQQWRALGAQHDISTQMMQAACPPAVLEDSVLAQIVYNQDKVSRARKLYEASFKSLLQAITVYIPAFKRAGNEFDGQDKVWIENFMKVYDEQDNSFELQKKTYSRI